MAEKRRRKTHTVRESRGGGAADTWILVVRRRQPTRLTDEGGPDVATFIERRQAGEVAEAEAVYAPAEYLDHIGLLANDLVDAMSTFTVPVVLGGGKKLFVDGLGPHSYKLTRSRVSSTGLMIGHYERGGEVKVADTALAEPSKAEAARQERMKRES